MSDPVLLLQSLLCAKSVTPDVKPALDCLEQMLTGAGFQVERITFTQEGTPDVENLFAKTGTGKPHLMFAGHVDVVPTGNLSSWRHDPFSGTLEEGRLYGRGAVDMKGGIACFLAAALDILKTPEPPKGTLSFLITGDEEGPAINGTRKLLEWVHARGERFDASIVGEPTNPDRIGGSLKVGRRGSLNGMLEIIGKQGHVAYPHLAANPIPFALKLAQALLTERFDEGSALFSPSNLEIISIDVDNPAYNVLPESARIRFNIRFCDIWTSGRLQTHVRHILEKAATHEALPKPPLSWQLHFETPVSEAFLCQDEALIKRFSDAVERITGTQPERSTAGGTSDARFIKDYCPVIEFGLSGRTMHQVDEHTSVKDLTTLTAIYRAFLEDWLS